MTRRRSDNLNWVIEVLYRPGSMLFDKFGGGWIRDTWNLDSKTQAFQEARELRREIRKMPLSYRTKYRVRGLTDEEFEQWRKPKS